MKKIGYARVSSLGQSLDKQMKALMAAGVEQEDIFWDDAVSGTKNSQAEGYLSLFEFIEDNPCEVIVARLDRFGRSTVEVLKGVDELVQKGSSFRTLDGALNIANGSPMSKFTLTLFAAVAELELSFIKARTAEGRVLAVERGLLMGPRPKFNRNQIKMIRDIFDSGETVRSIAKTFQCSRSTVERIVGLYNRKPYLPQEDWDEAKAKSQSHSKRTQK